MEIGLHIADFTWPGGPGALAENLTRIVAAAEDAGLDRVSVMDHVWQIGPLGPPERADARGLHDAGVPRGAHLPGRAAGLGDGRELPGPRAAGQDRHARWTCCRAAGRWLGIGAAWNERGGRRARPALPADRRAVRAAGGDAADLPADVERRRRPVRGRALPAGPHAELAAAAAPAAPADPDRRRRARRRRCGWWRSTPRRATCSPSTTLERKLDVLRAALRGRGPRLRRDREDRDGPAGPGRGRRESRRAAEELHGWPDSASARRTGGCRRWRRSPRWRSWARR